MTQYRLTDGTIGTMIPGDQVPEHWGACNPDKEGDLWLLVEGEKSPRCVDPSRAVFVPPEPMLARPERTDPMLARPERTDPPLTLDQMAQQLCAAGWDVTRTIPPNDDTAKRARSLMAGLEKASGATVCNVNEWRHGVADEKAVKAYTYLLEWARTVC